MDVSSHEAHGSSDSAASSMHSTFFDSSSTPLYAAAWQPSSTRTYAGTCIFLVLLAIIFRLLIAGKYVLERRWLDQALQRRYIHVAGLPTEGEKMDRDQNSEYSTLLSPRGQEERVKVVANVARPVTPWRISTDVPRALYTTVIAGVGYLL